VLSTSIVLATASASLPLLPGPTRNHVPWTRIKYQSEFGAEKRPQWENLRGGHEDLDCEPTDERLSTVSSLANEIARGGGPSALSVDESFSGAFTCEVIEECVVA